MNSSRAVTAGRIGLLVARWVLGGLFIYMGLSKALHPIEFLKLVRQYNVLDHYLLLNLTAALLPWFELFCGVLLVLGIAVRGVVVMLIAMLVPFTVLVFLRALNVQEASQLAFCAIKFDCGCGAGEVFICRKLAENVLLMIVSVALIVWSSERFSLRHTILRS